MNTRTSGMIWAVLIMVVGCATFYLFYTLLPSNGLVELTWFIIFLVIFFFLFWAIFLQPEQGGRRRR